MGTNPCLDQRPRQGLGAGLRARPRGAASVAAGNSDARAHGCCDRHRRRASSTSTSPIRLRFEVLLPARRRWRRDLLFTMPVSWRRIYLGNSYGQIGSVWIAINVGGSHGSRAFVPRMLARGAPHGSSTPHQLRFLPRPINGQYGQAIRLVALTESLSSTGDLGAPVSVSLLAPGGGAGAFCDLP